LKADLYDVSGRDGGGGAGHARCRPPSIAATLAIEEIDMDMNGTWGGLLPLWIIGAPWLLALLELARTPQPRVHQPAPPMPAAAGYTRPV